MSPWGPLTDGAPNCSRKRHEGGWFQKKTSLIRRRHGVDGMLVERHGRVAGYRIGKDQSAGMPDSLQPGPAAGQDHRSQLRVRIDKLTVSWQSRRFERMTGMSAFTPMKGH